MGNCNCTADDSTCNTPFGSCSFKHCGSSAQKETEQKSEDEQKFEFEMKQLEIALRVERRKREFDERMLINEYVREHGTLPSIEQLKIEAKKKETT